MKHSTVRALQLTWALIRGYRLLTLLNAFLWFSYFLIPIISGLLLQSVFNNLARRHPSEVLAWQLLALVLSVAVVGYLTTYLRIFIDNLVQFGVSARLRGNMLRYLLRRPGAEALPSSPGEAVSRFRDDVGLVTGFLFFPMLVTGSVGFGVTAFVVMAHIDAFITVVAVAPLFGIVAGTQLLTSRLQRYRKALREATGQVTGFLGEILNATLAVKVAGAEDKVLTRFHRLNAERKGVAIRDQVFGQALISAYTNTAQLRVAALEPDISSMTSGLETEVGRRGVQLSGGQVQRTAVARMLVRAPDLIVLDDVSSALDAETEWLLWQHLLEEKGETVLAVSHRRFTLERATRIVILHAGRVAATGPLSRVLKESAEARAIYEDAGK